MEPNVQSKSFVVGENIPMWARDMGAKEMYDNKSGKLLRVLMPSGVGDGIVSAAVGDTVAIIDGIALVIGKEVVDNFS